MKSLVLALLLLNSPPPVTDALDRYAADPAETVRSVAASQTLSTLNSSLRKDGVPWMLAKGAAEANQRRLIAATFALDVAGAEFDTAPGDVAPLVEWACEQIRRRLPSDQERQWHIAALALLEATGNPQMVETHLAHAAARFRDEPMWTRTRVWLADARTLNIHPRQPLSAARITFPAPLAAQYEALAATPELASDAWLRIGFMHFLAGAYPEARRDFTAAQLADTTDTRTRYLTQLFIGWMYEREQRHTEAIGAFRAAMTAEPAGRTAAVWLAARYAIAGRTDEAETVAAASLAGVDAGPDPWRTFYRGEWSKWPTLIAAARRLLK